MFTGSGPGVPGRPGFSQLASCCCGSGAAPQTSGRRMVITRCYLAPRPGAFALPCSPSDSRRFGPLLWHWGERLLGDRRQVSSAERPPGPPSCALSSPPAPPASAPGWCFSCSRLLTKVLLNHLAFSHIWTLLRWEPHLPHLDSPLYHPLNKPPVRKILPVGWECYWTLMFWVMSG